LANEAAFSEAVPEEIRGKRQWFRDERGYWGDFYGDGRFVSLIPLGQQVREQEPPGTVASPTSIATVEGMEPRIWIPLVLRGLGTPLQDPDGSETPPTQFLQFSLLEFQVYTMITAKVIWDEYVSQGGPFQRFLEFDFPPQEGRQVGIYPDFPPSVMGAEWGSWSQYGQDCERLADRWQQYEDQGQTGDSNPLCVWIPHEYGTGPGALTNTWETGWIMSSELPITKWAVCGFRMRGPTPQVCLRACNPEARYRQCISHSGGCFQWTTNWRTARKEWFQPVWEWDPVEEQQRRFSWSFPEPPPELIPRGGFADNSAAMLALEAEVGAEMWWLWFLFFLVP
jgi:hypothetical protein